MGSGCSFPEIADTLLVLGECIGHMTDAVRRYRKNTLIGECQIIVLPFLLTTDFKRQEHFIECNGPSAFCT
jgi:hypothetical protein